MFKFLTILLTFLTCGNAYLTDNNELRRQYNNYLEIFNKQETPTSFEAFVKNLNTIEIFNKENRENCRMYLTQHSDTFEDVYILKKCKT